MKMLQIEQDGKEKEDDSEYYNVLHAPYIAGFSERLAKDFEV